MARIDIPKLDDLTDRQRDAVIAAEKSMGFIANDALLMVKNPALAASFSSLVSSIYAPAKVDPGLKRLIGLVSSSAAGCQYCVGHTAHTSVHYGVSDEKLTNVWNFETSEFFDDSERAALRIAMHAGQTPNAVTDEMFASLDEYYDDDAKLEIVAVIALFGFLNRWNSTLATDLESLPLQSLESIQSSA